MTRDHEFETRITYGEGVLTRLADTHATSLRAETETFRERHAALASAVRAAPAAAATPSPALTDVALAWDGALRRLSDRARTVLATEPERHRAIFGGPTGEKPRTRATTRTRTTAKGKTRAKAPVKGPAAPPRATMEEAKANASSTGNAKAKAKAPKKGARTSSAASTQPPNRAARAPARAGRANERRRKG